MAQSSSADSDAIPEGAVNFDNLIVSVDTDTSTWEWSTIENAASSQNGSIVIAIPIHLENRDDGSHVINSIDCNITDPAGTEQADISSMYSNDIFNYGSIAAGASVDSVIHVIYHGAGTYSINFDNSMGVKATLPIEMLDAHTMGIRAIPDSMTQSDADSAVISGTTFLAEDMSITLSADRDSYNWVQASAPGDTIWDGRWCVGVPATITNTSSTDQSITTSVYAKFNPNYNLQDDPAPYFTDDVTNLGTIAAGQTVQSMIYFVYDGDGDYYLAMDEDGSTVFAQVTIAQYY